MVVSVGDMGATFQSVQQAPSPVSKCSGFNGSALAIAERKKPWSIDFSRAFGLYQNPPASALVPPTGIEPVSGA
jgi:hypothetical protein